MSYYANLIRPEAWDTAIFYGEVVADELNLRPGGNNDAGSYSIDSIPIITNGLSIQNIDNANIGKLTLDENEISTSSNNEDILITPHGTGNTVIKNLSTIGFITDNIDLSGNIDLANNSSIRFNRPSPNNKAYIKWNETNQWFDISDGTIPNTTEIAGTKYVDDNYVANFKNSQITNSNLTLTGDFSLGTGKLITDSVTANKIINIGKSTGQIPFYDSNAIQQTDNTFTYTVGTNTLNSTNIGTTNINTTNITGTNYFMIGKTNGELAFFNSNALQTNNNLTYNVSTNTLGTTNINTTNISATNISGSNYFMIGKTNGQIPFFNSNILETDSDLSFNKNTNELSVPNITCTDMSSNTTDQFISTLIPISNTTRDNLYGSSGNGSLVYSSTDNQLNVKDTTGTYKQIAKLDNTTSLNTKIPFFDSNNNLNNSSLLTFNNSTNTLSTDKINTTGLATLNSALVGVISLASNNITTTSLATLNLTSDSGTVQIGSRVRISAGTIQTSTGDLTFASPCLFNSTLEVKNNLIDNTLTDSCLSGITAMHLGLAFNENSRRHFMGTDANNNDSFILFSTDGGAGNNPKLRVAYSTVNSQPGLRTTNLFLNTNDSPSNGNLGINCTSNNASACLQVDSTSKGVLIPRMTSAQKNAISSPSTGLQIYDTTLNYICTYNGTNWFYPSWVTYSLTNAETATGPQTITWDTISQSDDNIFGHTTGIITIASAGTYIVTASYSFNVGGATAESQVLAYFQESTNGGSTYTTLIQQRDSLPGTADHGCVSFTWIFKTNGDTTNRKYRFRYDSVADSTADVLTDTKATIYRIL